MPALFAGCARVHMQAAKGRVGLHTGDVRMAADKKPGRVPGQFFFDARCIPARVAADMDHKHFYFFAAPPFLLGIHRSYIPSVYIAPHALQRTKSLQPVGNFDGAEIACMPYFIAGFKIAKHLLVKEMVGI